MYTIKINDNDPITCTDYGIHNRSGQKTLYMSFNEGPDISMKLDKEHNVEVIYSERQ